MVNQNNVNLIMDITDRAWEKVKDNYPDRLSLMMDIDSANRDCGLKLKESANAPEADFFHDIIGIGNNLNRQTKKLENCFLPRYAK